MPDVDGTLSGPEPVSIDSAKCSMYAFLGVCLKEKT